MHIHYIILDEDIYSARYLIELLERIRPEYCNDAVIDDPDDAEKHLSDRHVDLIFCEPDFPFNPHTGKLQIHNKGIPVIYTDSQCKSHGDKKSIVCAGELNLLKPYTRHELECALNFFEKNL